MRGRAVKAVSGWLWFKRSVELLLRNPKVGFAYFSASIVLWQVLTRIPIIGNLLQSFLQPLVLGLLVLMSARSNRSGPLSDPISPRAISQHIPSLLRVGFFSVAGLTLGAGLVKLATCNSELAGVIIGDWSGYSSIPLAEMTGMTFAVLLVPLTISFVLLFATWFAPPLIVLSNYSVRQSLWSSLIAARNNYRAFVLYGLIFGGSWVAYALLMYLVPGVLLVPAGQQRFLGPTVNALSSLYWPIAAPVMLMSVYEGYLDIFVPEEVADE